MEASAVIEVGAQWWASIWTIAAVWLYGNHGRRSSVHGAVCGFVSQIGWWTVMLTLDAWGLAPINIIMLAMHARNFWKNGRKETNDTTRPYHAA